MLGLVLVLLTIGCQAEKCRILAFMDGGDLMAYEAAVLKGLVDNLPAEEV